MNPLGWLVHLFAKRRGICGQWGFSTRPGALRELYYLQLRPYCERGDGRPWPTSDFNVRESKNVYGDS